MNTDQRLDRLEKHLGITDEPAHPDPPEDYVWLMKDGERVMRRVQYGEFFQGCDGRAEMWNGTPPSDGQYYILTRLPDKGTRAWALQQDADTLYSKSCNEYIHININPYHKLINVKMAFATDWEPPDDTK